MDKYNEKRWTELVLAFKKEFGRLPSTTDMWMLMEAEASIALSKDDSVQTMTFVEGREVHE